MKMHDEMVMGWKDKMHGHGRRQEMVAEQRTCDRSTQSVS